MWSFLFLMWSRPLNSSANPGLLCNLVWSYNSPPFWWLAFSPVTNKCLAGLLTRRPLLLTVAVDSVSNPYSSSSLTVYCSGVFLVQICRCFRNLFECPTQEIECSMCMLHLDSLGLETLMSSAVSPSFSWMTALVNVTLFTMNGSINNLSSQKSGGVLSKTKSPVFSFPILAQWS